ncbi:MAG: hypothetical protein P9M08_07630 [Candidatus Erginobacter occultus]|nr:hypothetical protein [Candidatus Erginobacter occultus]
MGGETGGRQTHELRSGPASGSRSHNYRLLFAIREGIFVEPGIAAGPDRFLAGGIGITPIRSICRWLTDTGSKADARVLYSARTPDDFVFLDDFKEMTERNPQLSLVLTLTDEDPPGGWDCRAGRICSEMVREETPDYRDRTFFICAPPRMVEGMVGMLKDDLALPAAQIISEDFKGY